MVVAEILTGIALVQKSVDFIKTNIGTVNDIKDIVKTNNKFKVWPNGLGSDIS
jgi:hypothetical protein